MARKRLTAVGTGLIALDVVYAPDEEPRTWAGGTCANVLAILAYLGWQAYPVGRLAGDPAGELVAKDLDRWDVRLDYLRIGSEAPTPVIVERISLTREGHPIHRFSFRCPECRG